MLEKTKSYMPPKSGDKIVFFRKQLESPNLLANANGDIELDGMSQFDNIVIPDTVINEVLKASMDRILFEDIATSSQPGVDANNKDALNSIK